MRKHTWYHGLMLALLFIIPAFGATRAGAETTVQLATNRPDAIYARGEPIQFTIKVLSDGIAATGNVQYVISNDGAKPLKSDSVELKNGRAQVTWIEDSPMVVRCTAAFTPTGEKPVSGMAAAAVDPFAIQPTAIEPEDFDAYWKAQKALLAKIPMNPQMTSVAVKVPGVEVYDVTLDNVDGTQVHGYFGRPEGAGPFPAILKLPGASERTASLHYATSMAARGFLALSISVHDLPNGQPAEFYKERLSGPRWAYWLKGRDNRDSYFFHRVILGNIRSIDFLTSQAQWDQHHLIANGASQGGGLTLITTALDARITAAAANVPALCDHSGRDFGRPSGWPQLVPVDANGKLDPYILQLSRYYDAVNFARRIKVPVIFGVGLIDNTCHPTTVFSAYNVVQSPKQIDIAPLMGHSFSPSYIKMLDAFIAQQARL